MFQFPEQNEGYQWRILVKNTEEGLQEGRKKTENGESWPQEGKQSCWPTRPPALETVSFWRAGAESISLGGGTIPSEELNKYLLIWTKMAEKENSYKI